MNRIILSLLLLIGAGIMVSKGQSVRLNIVLNRVQNLTIHPQQDQITLSYSNMDDYRQGVQSLQLAHISLFSTEAFEVKVKLANSEFISLDSGPGRRHPLSGIRMNARAVVHDGELSMNQVSLDNRESVFISSGRPNLGATFDVTYIGPSGSDLLDLASQQQVLTLTNDILYSIETR